MCRLFANQTHPVETFRMALFFGSTELQLIRVECFWLSLVGIWMLYGLLAFWLAKRNWHWFISFAIIAAAASWPRIIEAGDLMLMQFANCLTAFFAFKIWNRVREIKEQQRGGESSGRHYLSGLKSNLSLANLLLLVAALAIVFAMLNVDLTNLEPLSRSIGFGLAAGVAFAAGFGLASVSRWWALVVAVPLWTIGIYNAYYWIFPAETKSSLFMAMVGTSFIWSELHLFARAVLVAVAVFGWVAGLIHRMSSQNKGIMLLVGRAASVLFGFVVLLMGMGLIDVGIKLSHRYSNPEARQRPLPERLSQIGSRFAASQIFDSYPPTDEVTLQTEIAAFNDAFSKLREILDKNDVVRPRQELDIEADMNEPQSIRSIARALSTKARFEFAYGNFDQSLADSILTVRLGRPLSNKLTLVSELVANAVEGIGHFSAAESIGFASRPATEEALQQLLRLDSTNNDPELIYTMDHEVDWNNAAWWGRLWVLCHEQDSREAFEQNIMGAVRRVWATRQQVIAMLALELYRLDHGQFPQSMEDLVPRYLASVPYDPFRSKDRTISLRYEQTDSGKDYWLYSFGYDRNDDQGRVSEFGYGTPGDEGEDLNLKEAAKQELIERDKELKKAAAEESAIE